MADAAGEEEWRLREEEYRTQILALEEEQQTLREAWSEIVRTNTENAETLKSQLKTAADEKAQAQQDLDKVLDEQKDFHGHLASELAAAKLAVAQLSEQYVSFSSYHFF